MLPLDLIYHTLDVVNDVSTLKAASTACKLMTGVSQRRLFKAPSFTLSIDEPHGSNQFYTFTQSLSTYRNPELSSYVKDLTINFVDTSSASSPVPVHEPHRDLHHLLVACFGRLGALESLTLMHGRGIQYREVVVVLNLSALLLPSFQCLSRIHLQGVFSSIPARVLHDLSALQDLITESSFDFIQPMSESSSAFTMALVPRQLRSLDYSQSKRSSNRLSALAKPTFDIGLSLEKLQHFAFASSLGSDHVSASEVLRMSASTLTSFTYSIPKGSDGGNHAYIPWNLLTSNLKHVFSELHALTSITLRLDASDADSDRAYRGTEWPAISTWLVTSATDTFAQCPKLCALQINLLGLYNHFTCAGLSRDWITLDKRLGEGRLPALKKFKLLLFVSEWWRDTLPEEDKADGAGLSGELENYRKEWFGDAMERGIEVTLDYDWAGKDGQWYPSL